MAETASFMQGQKIDKSNPGGGLATGGKDDGGPLESLNDKLRKNKDKIVKFDSEPKL